jgi:hypothetical protein
MHRKQFVTLLLLFTEKKGVIEGVSAQFRTVVRSSNTGEDIGTLKKAYNATPYVEQKNKKEYRSAGISKQKKTHPRRELSLNMMLMS